MLSFLALPPGYVWLAPYFGAVAATFPSLLVVLLILRHVQRARAAFRAVPGLRED